MSYPTHYAKSFAVRDPFFGSVLDRFFTTATADNSAVQSSERNFAPRVDVLESESDFKLVVDLPGYSKEDVTIELEEGILTLKASKSVNANSEKSAAGYRAVRTERVSGLFQRRFTLDDSVAVDAVEAKLENGVLEVRLPKVEEPEPERRTITIS